MGKELAMESQRKFCWKKCTLSLDEKACVGEVWMNWGIVPSTRNIRD